jgi:hypothetical protein
MRKPLTIAAIGALAAFGAAIATAQEGTDPTVARSYDLTGFDAVSVVGPHHVVVTVGPAFSIRAEGPQKTLDDTEVEIEDGRLEIHPVDDDRWERRGNDRQWRERWENYQPATFYVTLPAVEAVSLIGGGDMRVDRVERREFSASVAGSGALDVAVLRVDDAHFSIAGSGDLVAHGSATRQRVSIAGSGNLRMRDVASSDASVSIAGSGNAELTVENAARVSLVGGGDVDIAGAARCDVSRMGGGRVRCGGENVTG